MGIVDHFFACHTIKINKITYHTKKQDHHHVSDTHDLFVGTFLFTEFTAQFGIINIQIILFSAPPLLLLCIRLLHRNLFCCGLAGLFILSLFLRLFIQFFCTLLILRCPLFFCTLLILRYPLFFCRTLFSASVTFDCFLFIQLPIVLNITFIKIKVIHIINSRHIIHHLVTRKQIKVIGRILFDVDNCVIQICLFIDASGQAAVAVLILVVFLQSVSPPSVLTGRVPESLQRQ